jgi:hypothetical protein
MRKSSKETCVNWQEGRGDIGILVSGQLRPLLDDRYGAPLSSVADIRDGDYSDLTGAALVMISRGAAAPVLYG